MQYKLCSAKLLSRPSRLSLGLNVSLDTWNTLVTKVSSTPRRLNPNLRKYSASYNPPRARPWGSRHCSVTRTTRVTWCLYVLHQEPFSIGEAVLWRGAPVGKQFWLQVPLNRNTVRGTTASSSSCSKAGRTLKLRTSLPCLCYSWIIWALSISRSRLWSLENQSIWL